MSDQSIEQQTALSPRRLPFAAVTDTRMMSLNVFLTLLALVVFVVLTIDQSRRNVTALSRYIEIDMPNSSVEWIPRVNNDVIGSWILRTENAAMSVLDYYQRIAARDGWEIKNYASPNFVSLQKAGIEISLMAKNSEVEDTVVIITLANAEK